MHDTAIFEQSSNSPHQSGEPKDSRAEAELYTMEMLAQIDKVDKKEIMTEMD